MDQEMLRKVQKAQLSIAKEIKRVCEKNDIQYFLDSGSLLGAIRHKGFIPWDDDMDFGMLSDQYEKFISIAPKELGDDYFLQTWESDKHYPFAFAKVMKRGTLFVEDVFQDSNKHNELYVDIFPYYVYPNSKRNQRKLKGKVQYYKHIMMVKDGMKPWKRPHTFLGKMIVLAKYVPFIILSLCYKRERLIIKYKSVLNSCKFTDNKYFFPAGTSKVGKWLIPSSCLATYTESVFEDTEFCVPGNSDLYLSNAYGDYMELPPVDQRENRHNIVKIEL